MTALAAGALLAAAAPAHAAWPGANGRIAFSGTKRDYWGAWTSALDGSRQDRLQRFKPMILGLESQSGPPQWAPSGRRLLWWDYGRGIRIATASGRRVRTIRSGLLWPSGGPPSGTRLVAIDATTTPAGLAILAAHGTGERRIMRPPGDGPALPRWSRGGRWIVYEDGNTVLGTVIRRIRPDGTGARDLGPGHLASWAPDGSRFAVGVGPDVWEVGPGGRRRELVHARNRDSTDAGLSWSRDGRRIAFIRQVPADEHDSSTVMTAPASGGHARRQWFTRRFVSALDWQPR